MKAELINFELWFTYDEEHDQDKLDRLNIELVITDIKEAIATKNVDCIVGLLLVDGFLYKDNDRFYSILEKIYQEGTRLGIKKFYLMPGMCSNYQTELNQRSLNYEILDWNFPVNQMYQSYKGKLDQVPEWNPSANKFLFLGGVPSRPNRIGLMSKYYDAGLLDRGEWSFFSPWTADDQQWCREHLSYYTTEQYAAFLKFCDRAVDEKYAVSKDYSRVSGKEMADRDLLDSPWLNDCGWIDPKIYHITSVSIISEGSCYPPAVDFEFLTEKIWRAVINNHPFIVADHPDRFTFMKQIGLRTFEDYLEFPNYALMPDENDRLNTVVENTRYFLDNIDKNKNRILNDINYNKSIMFNILEKNNTLVEWLQTELALTTSSIEKWLMVKDFKTYIRIPKCISNC
jgi:hypothetical protein